MSKLKVDDILTVASLWGIKDEHEQKSRAKRSKKDLVSFIVSNMCVKSNIRRTLASLSEQERYILGIFATNNWSLDTQDLYALGIDESALGIFPYNVFSYDRSYYQRRTESSPKGLLGMLLLIRKRKYGSSGPIIYIVPKEFRKAIKYEFALRYTTMQEIEDAKVTDRRYEGDAILDDLFTLLSFAASGIRLTPARSELPKRTADKITNMLRVKTRDRLDQILDIAHSLNLLTVDSRDGRNVMIATSRVEEFLKKSRAERLKSIFDAAFRHADRLEQMIIQELKSLKSDTWYDRAQFYRLIRNKIFVQHSRDWFVINYAGAISGILSQLMHLGMLEVGKFHEDSYTHEVFRLKPPFYGIRTDEEPLEAERGLIVQPSFEVIALPETSEEVLFMLSRFAELKSQDKVRIYMLTKQALLNAIDNGLELMRIIEFLEREAKTEIPQNVRYTLEDWAKQYGRVELRTGVLLEAEPELLAVIKAKKGDEIEREVSDSSMILKRGVIADLLKEEDCVYLEAKDAIAAAELERVIGDYVIKKLSGCIFVISNEDVDKCREIMKKKGIFPRDLFEQKRAPRKGTRMRDLIEEAIRDEKKIRMIYMSGGYRETERVIAPYNVNDRYVEGYCYLRNERRIFRLDRIKWLEVLDEGDFAVV